MKKLIFILSTIISITFTNCNETGDHKMPSSRDTLNTIPEKTKNIFDNPEELINILSKNGLGQLKEWQNPFEMGWGSLTDYYQFGSQKDGIGMQNNIAYYLEGTETSVTSVMINLNINNPAEKKDALKFLSETTEKTFNSLHLALPLDLKKSILESKPYKGNVDNFIISNELEQSKIETWKVIISKK